jgi:hypothetical protein
LIVRRLIGTLLAAAGAAGVTACLMSAFRGMRHVMVADGGSCASGGPYVIAHQCTGGDIRLLMVGIIGMLVSAGFLAAGTGLLGGRAGLAGYAMWAALFGTLGWNFIHLGQHPPAGTGNGSGWLFTGVVFWVMAAGGLIPAVWSVVNWLVRGSRSQPRAAGVQPMARAQLPGMGGGTFTMGGGQFAVGGQYGAGGQFGPGGGPFNAGGGQFGAPPPPGGGPASLHIPGQEDAQ